ncbi:MAG: hypothetical protein JWP58_4125 [Hymenobacter sp.]|nr:hypothetical protein [Hymenobacter sp.]
MFKYSTHTVIKGEKPILISPLVLSNAQAEKQKGPPQITERLFCGNSWNRTNDTSIFSAVLYQLSYVAVSP